ncbi:molybdopterin-binding protein [Nocardioides euryhalodurans]|uniref:Molybdopterin-binding protein n=1 Tax=Nocardioides euryhalodurans TaxID=2518370 RepID=A0A4P7GPX4_9ACTN|nr:molybdopterin-binding protein [Nocardioides euryhalodurans]
MRSPAVASRVGVLLGISFGLCFLTGLVSHYAQLPQQPVPFPASPAWGYRVTQGLHVISGTAAVPLLLVKLWTVYPRLFLRPPRRLRGLLVEVAERGSIAVLVASAVFLLASGLANSTAWYPWAFSFRTTHYALAWVAIGALVLHVAVKLPLIRQALRADVDDTALDRPTATEPGALSRRGLLRTTWLAAGVAVVATAGNSVGWLREVSVLAVRSSDGPQGLPVTKSARAAGVLETATSPAYRLTVEHAGERRTFGLEELQALPQVTETLPIACVEGWSENAEWTGVRLRTLLDLVGAPAGSAVVFESLQESGAFRTSALPGHFADDDRTLVALRVNGEVLSLDHGHPCRLIAPNRPGVRQTKWLSRVVAT